MLTDEQIDAARAEAASVREYQVGNSVDAYTWLLDEMGRHGLSGMFLRKGAVVFVPTIGERGYIAPADDDDENGPATFQSVDAKSVVARLALSYYIWRRRETETGSVDTKCFFPETAATLALRVPDQASNLRSLRGVTHTPMVRADGTVLDTPGYDRASRYLYLPSPGLTVRPVPSRPTSMQVRAAVKLLRHIISEFTWAGDHDEVNFLGLLLTPLLREMCPPPYKLGAIMARQPGSGKSLLNRILRDVHGGVFRSEMPHDDAELEKTISSILTCTTAPVVQFDNVSGTLRSSRLAGLLTSAAYSGRILGSTSSVDMANDRLWTITGNNLNLGGDLVRRALWVTIDPGCPDPHLRTGFTLNIPQYVAEHRGDILHGLLTLVTAWHAAGGQREERSSDDYARWSSVVRGILAHASIPGEFDHQESAQQTVGTDDEGWGEFLTVVREAFPGDFTTRDLVDRMDGAANMDPPPQARELVDALPSELHERYVRARQDAKAITRPLGMWLKNRDGRYAGTLVCRKSGHDASRNVPKWRVMDHGESREWVARVS